ncbi:E3 ubiquitin-protein ligase SHPRH [Drosophila eugracilis]|uniref:E3 ubiquitin-protein ligase SHPRH n=1 Tax=Drosophila eugracilis TaxID=29029 RepID=UPI0007E7AAC0|nr:E3 ubiquitin-protein ligase SHPRH [Drosophila eugracilis]
MEGIVLCEIADEVAPECVKDPGPLEFQYVKKRWVFKEFFIEYKDVLLNCIEQCQKARTRKLKFKPIQQDTDSWSLVLCHNQTHVRARVVEMEVAAKLLPIVFKNFEASLEFEVAQQEQEHKRPLKTYVTTKLYDALYEKHRQTRNPDQDLPLNLPERFQSRLRKYQERTVSWMLGREQHITQVPANYTVLLAVDGKNSVLKHNYCLQFYTFDDELPKITLPPGGILADEMGLGKTVEFLAMLLMNPRPQDSFRNDYWHQRLDEFAEDVPLKRARMHKKEVVFCICTQKRGTLVQCSKCRRWQHERCMGYIPKSTIPHLCPTCWVELGKASERLVETGATIIVSPNPIKLQWFQEIRKHISPALKVLLYLGLNSSLWVSPLELANYDVVLTDYTILRNEIYHTTDYKSDRQMRHQQVYMRPYSPLLMVNWWRVCLDEAQMVESNTSAAAEMVRMLPAINRWAVTGTIDDLPPLLEFVGRSEICRPTDAWQTVDKAFQLNYKCEPLLELLEHSLWRTCKSKVEHELGIPPQTEVVHRLELSNVESLYYREEHQKCHEQFLSAVTKHTRHNADNSFCLASISPQLLRIILKPFLRIRQTCSVPVVLNSNVSSADYLNPHDLLMRLKSNNENECKTELRSWASSYNGLAAIHFIKEDFPQAIKYYKLLLKLAAEYNEQNISVDSVLQIHAIYNVLQASELAKTADKLTELEQHDYQVQMKRLEWKYLQDNTNVLENALGLFEEKLKEVYELEKQFDGSTVDLLATVVNHKTSLHDAVWNKVRDDFFRQNISVERLDNVNSMAGMLYFVDLWHKKLQKLKTNLLTEFEYLKGVMQEACGAVKKGELLSQDINNFIGTVTDCHLAEILEENKDNDKPEKPKKRRHCRLCKIRDSLNQFECLLFAKKLDEQATATEGLEIPSMEISLIKSIFSFLRSKPEFSEWKAECQNKLDLLLSLQELVKLQIKYWIEVEYMVKAFDELEMCRMRILLTDDPEEQSNYRILPCQLDEQLEFNQYNLRESQLNFTRLCGRLKYLKHLKEDTADKPCPICQTQDDVRYVMMVCGHFVCQYCLDSMRKKYSSDSVIKCPLCRQDSPQLYYSIRPGAHKTIIGDFSTKIANIVELVLKIKGENEQEKILIFSQWQAILVQIARALSLNSIHFRNKCSNKDFEDFKDPFSNVTCLLMPLSKGSKGLNLIEATHVFLVEPILNPGDERQAIGRIHRFGQNKPTKVHRFIVNGTIEENILSLITSADDTKTLSTHWDLENMTLDSLKKLFILKEKE